MKALITLIALVFTIGGSAQDPYHEFRTQITGKDLNVVHPKVTVFLTQRLELKANGELEYAVVEGDIQMSQSFKKVQWEGSVKELTITYKVDVADHNFFIESCEIQGDYESAYQFFLQYWPTTDTNTEETRSRYYLEDRIVLTPSNNTTAATVVITSTGARE